MKRRENQRENPFTRRAPLQPSKLWAIELAPEELAVFVRRAEQILLPIIEALKPIPRAALFLLAQFTQVCTTGTEALTLERARALSDTVLALWEARYYTPGPDYPFTFQETLQERDEHARTLPGREGTKDELEVQLDAGLEAAYETRKAARYE